MTGSLLFAAEVERRDARITSMRALAERSRIWRAKMASGLAVAMPALLLPALVDGARGLVTTVVATEILLLAAAASAFANDVSGDRNGGPLLVVAGVVLARLTYDRSFEYSVRGFAGVVAFLSLFFVAVVVFASWLWFCRRDRGRTPDGSCTLLTRLPAGWILGALWLSVARQWPIWLMLGVAYVVYCVFFPNLLHSFVFYSLMEVAPAVLLAIGCLFGWNVFAPNGPCGAVSRRPAVSADAAMAHEGRGRARGDRLSVAMSPMLFTGRPATTTACRSRRSLSDSWDSPWRSSSACTPAPCRWRSV